MVLVYYIEVWIDRNLLLILLLAVWLYDQGRDRGRRLEGLGLLLSVLINADLILIGGQTLDHSARILLPVRRFLGDLAERVLVFSRAY